MTPLAAVALPRAENPALVVRRTSTRVGAEFADRQTLVVGEAVLLLADELVPVPAVLPQTHAREVLVDARLQDAAAAEVIAELLREHTRHIPAREVLVGAELKRPLIEAL